MKAFNEKVIVEIGEPYEEQISYGSLDLHIDPQFNPTKYSKTIGKVVSAGHKTTGLAPGDIIAFHFGAIDINPDDKKVAKGQYIIEYRDVFCEITQDGGVMAVGRWCVCEPVPTEIPEGYHLEEIQGSQYLISPAGLVADTNFKVEYDDRVKVVSHPRGLYHGDIMFVPENCNWDNYGRTILGKRYFYVEEDLLLAKWDQ